MLIDVPVFIDDADMLRVQEAIDAFLARGAQSLLILAAEDSGQNLAGWNSLLRALPVPVFGGVFPRVLFAGQAHACGVLIVALSCRAEVCIVADPDGVASAREALHEALQALRTARTVMLWVDGLSAHIETLISEVYDVLGAGPAFLGGGAGSTRLCAEPCLFSARGVTGGAQIVGLPVALGLGVRHGWEPVAGPFLVSSVSGCRIQGLDFRPALEVYREEVRRLSGQMVDPANFFSTARAFPLGLERMDGSFIVRDPVRAEGDSVVCIGEVPAQSALHILHGRPAALMKASEGACQDALDSGVQPAAALLVDCLSRALHLDAVHEGQAAIITQFLSRSCGAPVPVFGVLSLGEIASEGAGCLEFHNKTFVLGLIPHAGTQPDPT
ncbi:FIST signal transduction protein [Uliginosibacterium paludis]|uniref:FIST C-terminal domain-containing protein n=1 Tax=Uliginosibacterium paludis TaxID=1615952 RepID=A0ABV2CWF3_9RHOO